MLLHHTEIHVLIFDIHETKKKIIQGYKNKNLV